MKILNGSVHSEVMLLYGRGEINCMQTNKSILITVEN